MRSPALSFSNNPSLEALFRAVLGGDSVTFLCGAGVSVDAGLPTWTGLLRRIAASRTSDNRSAELALKAGEDDLARTAGLLLREKLGVPDYAAIADALYGEQRHLPASYLARHIVSLAVAMPAQMALVTTNFDDVLERALREDFPEVVSCSLDSKDRWWRAFFEPSDPIFHVLHLHGALTRDRGSKSVLGPLVLTEDDFYRHGADVQAEVDDVLKESTTVVCIGLSLTDPNIVGPLSRRDKDDNGSIYIVSVPSRNSNLDADEALDFAESREKYLKDLFGVNVVPLNSYSQIHQLFIDLELAVTDSDRYLSSGTSSHRYGYRLARCLRASYKELGYPARTRSASKSALSKASDKLNELVPAVQQELSGLVKNSDSRAAKTLLKSLGKATTDIRDRIREEGLGLFLWMPARFDPTDKDGQRTHALSLVAASAYAHREEWSFSRSMEINSYGVSTVQKAAFLGQPIFEDANLRYEPRLWMSNAAVPLSLIDDTTNSVVTAGVVVLSSARPMLPDDWDGSAVERSTVLSVLSLEDQVEFARYLSEATAALLGCGRS